MTASWYRNKVLLVAGASQGIGKALVCPEAHFGHLDIVIYCAAVEYLGPITSLTPDELQSGNREASTCDRPALLPVPGHSLPALPGNCDQIHIFQ